MIDIDWNKAPEGAVALKQDLRSGDGEVTWFNSEDDRWSHIDRCWLETYHQSHWKTIATRPQRKTVKDAVDAFPSGLKFHYDARVGESIIIGVAECIKPTKLTDYGGNPVYFEEGLLYAVCEGFSSDHFKLVCTREEFEEEVKRREGEQEQEWTHLDALGEPCRMLIGEPDSMGKVVIFRQDGWYSPVALNSLTPIETITREEAEKRLGVRIK